MRVRFFGVRGSIATPGPSTVRYGGNTVCVEVQLADDTRIVLDAGTGIRECGKQLEADGYTGTIHLFITHPHWDHLIGLPFLLWCVARQFVAWRRSAGERRQHVGARRIAGQ